MKISKNVLGLAAVVGLLALVFAVVNPGTVRAALGLDVRSTNTSNPLATTTINYMTPGVGTTTLSLYTGNTDQVDLNILYEATTSAGSILKWRYEYSNNGTDWFADSNDLSANATTTVQVRDFAEYSWAYASSTGGSSTASKALKHVRVTNINSYFFRAVFYVPIGAQNGGVYVQSTQKTANPI